MHGKKWTDYITFEKKPNTYYIFIKYGVYQILLDLVKVCM